ncbi:RDD family protein [Arthrobacter sp. Sa2BUA2]|uniref:RDD family protein n=1 Tax=Arthrobacter pullicola TaxID=2762224 RepID=A0ABR8YLI1_9MICC|nr:RDD family protein [Arthrobacter pullicola]MBD8044997.1 RDD family protein [Arthrobacter pullicola]
MVDRRSLGSWLQGPPSDEENWPGRRLGRPRTGPGSIARVGPRLGAIIIDWALASLISYAFFGGTATANLLVFAAEQIILVGLLGYSVGHRVFSLQVQKLDGSAAGPLAGAVRSILICLVIPALIFDADQRGLHDKAMNTILVRVKHGSR